ncbi:MAG: hypothetical protein ABSF38_20155 [Verrucomicrobiota bacterium]
MSSNKLALPETWSKGAASPIFAEIRVVLAVLGIAIFAGCDTDTGTKKVMQPGAVSKIDDLTVQVSVDRDFSLTLAAAKPRSLKEVPLTFTAVRLGSLVSPLLSDSGPPVVVVSPKSIAAAKEWDAQHAAEDARRAEAFRSKVAEIRIQSTAENALMDALQAARRFQTVTTVSVPQRASPACTGTLWVRIENWGLYADSRENAVLDQVQVGLNATAVLMGAGGKRIWEHADYFTSGIHRPITEYGSSPDLLKNEMEETTRRYCATVANEIRYAP